ncbi:sel1 repeat family protein [Aeromonas sp. FDAARGOS 1409]|uniref:tetratricopeptide repeat protein n=1 Tax=Aeromonas TaxID=642 RepID=UPI001C242C4E|nr:tetratricopeptide repeat protein [Aeromonas sp. FDAARGOS 1409]QXC30745.1 sel1 repeat family protein [Aeromonas sp. FDAARGOS 1409]
MFLADKTAKKRSRVHYFLGQRLASGQGIEQSYRLAYYHYHKAATAGYLGTQCELGLLSFSGLGVTQNTAKAVTWYKKSAMQGDGEAQLSLGKMYLSGSGVPQDDELAYYWLSKAAAQGEREALLQLWKITEKDIPPLEFDLDSMVAYYELDDLNDPDVQFWLGILASCFIYSQSVLLQPATWFSKAAKQGHRSAQYRLAIHYALGLGVSQSASKADFWYHQAATHNSSPTWQQL